MNRTVWSLLFLQPPEEPVATTSNEPSATIVSAIERLAGLRKWVGAHLPQARQTQHGIDTGFNAVVVAGRRPPPHSPVTSLLRELNDHYV